MYKNINKIGFTLIELMVWITIIWIMSLWIRNIAFNNISDKQKLEIFNNKIISEIEKVRNDSLIWKWIWINIDAPKSWKIDFSTNSWWKILTSYTIDWTNWVQINNIPMENLMSINKVSCVNVDNSSTQNLTTTQTWSILFEKWKYKLSWNCNNTFTSLKIETYNKWYLKEFSFDVISWIIKR